MFNVRASSINHAAVAMSLHGVAQQPSVAGVVPMLAARMCVSNFAAQGLCMLPSLSPSQGVALIGTVPACCTCSSCKLVQPCLLPILCAAPVHGSLHCHSSLNAPHSYIKATVQMSDCMSFLEEVEGLTQMYANLCPYT